METKAVLRYARISPQKCRLVVDTIRGKSATLAVNTLKFMPKKGAAIVLKVLDSAIANAYNNFNADVDDLKVTRIEVDPAPVLKRFHARAKGRGVRIAKRNSHITGSSVRRKARRLMGQKVNPIGIRLGITRDWTSKWYAGSKTFASNIHTDFLVRQYLMKKLADASVSRIHIERAARRANITHSARRGRES